MFVNEVISKPRVLDGRKFVERTINSKFDKGTVTITTIYMDDKPFMKQYLFDGENVMKSFWKSVVPQKDRVQSMVYDKNLNIIV